MIPITFDCSPMGIVYSVLLILATLYGVRRMFKVS